MRAKIIYEQSGAERGLVNKWTIPNTFLQYLEEDCVIIDADSVTHVPYVDRCQACDSLFVEATHPAQNFCRYQFINQHYGYVAKICVDCNWLLSYRAGNHNVPKSVMKTINAGHSLKLFD